MKTKGFPGWIQNAKWEENHAIKRTHWNRLILTQLGVGEKGIALRYRTFQKTERVAA